MEKAKAKKHEEKKEKPNYIEQIQRLQAEFDNFRKRVDREKQEIYKNANEELVFKLLAILDNFELALKHIDDKGVKMIYSELYSILEKEGLKSIKAQGKFNPEIHEALMQEQGGEDDKITEELQKGYTLNDKVIRASKVKITKQMEKKNG